MRILIAEDDFTCRRVLMQYLRQIGSVDVAISGNEAIAAFNDALDAGEPYDLVCLDIQMADGDGHAALCGIREAEEARRHENPRFQHVPVVMTTAFDDRSNILESFREQCEAYLIKPITPDRLWPTLRELSLPVPPGYASVSPTEAA